MPFGRLWYGEPNAVSNAVDYRTVSSTNQCHSKYNASLSDMKTIFISYRRSDSYDTAHRLDIELRREFGEGNVFLTKPLLHRVRHGPMLFEWPQKRLMLCW